MLRVFKRALIALTVIGALFLALPAKAFCFNEAGLRYHVDPLLLRAMTKVESNDNPEAINYNRNKKGQITSHDDGLMQINSIHIPGLLAMGVLRSEKELLTNPCLNVQVGAWILARHLQVCGVTWECLGSYNAGFATDNKTRRMIYARKVYDMYLRLSGRAT